MKICIDPGHSGPYEPGSCADGVAEATLNLAISNALGEALILLRHDVLYTRCGDIETDELVFRAEVANKNQADLFVSIHCNSAKSIEAKGIEVYRYPGSSSGMLLATDIQKVLIANTPFKDRGVKKADFVVLRLTDMPAALVQCGFISSAIDQAVLVDPNQQKNIAQAIATGIDHYCNY